MSKPIRSTRISVVTTALLLFFALFVAACSDNNNSTDDSATNGSNTVDGTTGSSDAQEDVGGSNLDESNPSGAHSTGKTGELSLLIYNVAGLPQEISTESPTANIPQISAGLEAYDLVFAQEIFDWWLPGGLIDELQPAFVNYLDWLLADTTFEHVTPKHPGNESVGISLEDRPLLQLGDGINIFSRFELRDVVTVPWTDCFGSLDTSDGGAADCAAMKGFRVATITLGGQDVDVYSLHAEAGGTERDQELQVDNFKQLAAFIAEHSGDRPVIVGGDTNLHTESTHADGSDGADTVIWRDFLAETGLTDTCAVMNCAEADSIDKIAFRSTDGIEFTVESYEHVNADFLDDQGNDLSDHPPVAVRFTWVAR